MSRRQRDESKRKGKSIEVCAFRIGPKISASKPWPRNGRAAASAPARLPVLGEKGLSKACAQGKREGTVCTRRKSDALERSPAEGNSEGGPPCPTVGRGTAGPAARRDVSECRETQKRERLGNRGVGTLAPLLRPCFVCSGV